MTAIHIKIFTASLTIDTKPQGVKAYKHTHNVADSDIVSTTIITITIITITTRLTNTHNDADIDVDSPERSLHIHNFNEVEFRSTCEEMSSTRVEKDLASKPCSLRVNLVAKKTSV